MIDLDVAIRYYTHDDVLPIVSQHLGLIPEDILFSFENGGEFDEDRSYARFFRL